MLVVFDHTPAEKGPVSMLTQEEAVDIHALHRRGITISEIARRTGRDRKTIRAYLAGEREPGVRKRDTDYFLKFEEYVTARLIEDPHLFAQTLFDELTELGFTGSYQTLTRNIRARNLRPACQACAHVTQRPNAIIDHPPGEETQFDWVELPDPPRDWGFPVKKAYVLVGSLPFSGKWRAVVSPSDDQAHLMHAIHQVIQGIGGVTQVWRFDRMSQVINPHTKDLTKEFAAFAKHYSVRVIACRPRSGNRKGVVEKNNHTIAQRWWRNLPDEITLVDAQQHLNAFALKQDKRKRNTSEGKSTPAGLVHLERLVPAPLHPYPSIIVEQRTVSRQALIYWRGNRYSVPPEFATTKVNVSFRLGAQTIDIASPQGTVIARHSLKPDGLGVTVRETNHVIALEKIALASAPPGKPHRKKERIPPGERARLAAKQLIAPVPASSGTVIDLSVYESIARGRNTLS